WRYLRRQALFFGLAFGIMFVVAQVNLKALARWAPWLYGIGVLLLLAVMFFGVGAKGAQRWLSIGGFRFQPAEIMKLSLPIMVAAYLAQRHIPPHFKHVFWGLVFVVVPVLLIAQQPDLGTSLLIASS